MTEALNNAYLLGRQFTVLEDPFKGEDRTYANQRLDGQTVTDGYFAHCTFANVSFKATTLERTRFIDCLFVSAYFRRTAVTGCSFSGCRFVDCEFPNISVSTSRFQYCRFRQCYIPYSQLKLNMPSEPNLRKELAHNLAVETETMGFYDEATAYRWDEIRSHESNLSLAVRGATVWYQKHYDLPMRVLSAIRLVASVLNRHLWGYGERVWILIRNWLLLSFLVFPMAFVFIRESFTKKTAGTVEISDLVRYSLATILGSVPSNISPITPLANFLTTLESTVGIVATGLFITYLFRWISRR